MEVVLAVVLGYKQQSQNSNLGRRECMESGILESGTQSSLLRLAARLENENTEPGAARTEAQITTRHWPGKDP